MREHILQVLNDPREMEALYRRDKAAFHKAFDELYPEISGQAVAEIWQQRLHYNEEKSQGTSLQDWLFVILLCALAGGLAKFPQIFDWDSGRFYSRNIGYLVFPFLAFYYARLRGMALWPLLSLLLLLALSVVYVNRLPEPGESQSIVLAFIHMPIFLACLWALTVLYPNYRDVEARQAFLRSCGDLLVMSAILVLAGGLLIGMSIGLFHAIGMDLENFYAEYVLVFGACAVPLVATHVIRVFPGLVGRVSPLVARLFAPLLLITLLVYLPVALMSGKSPFTDREFLILFNGLLVLVMAIILFSVAEGTRSQWNLWILFLLSLLSIAVNLLALSAIVFRIYSYGLTPNKASVLGGNVLIMIHLLLVTYRLFRALRGEEREALDRSLVRYLPLYVLWSFFVAFFFPLLFGMK